MVLTNKVSQIYTVPSQRGIRILLIVLLMVGYRHGVKSERSLLHKKYLKICFKYFQLYKTGEIQYY